MKKLLSLLGAVGLIATSSATVVSCGDPDKGTSNNGGNDDDNANVKDLTYFLDIKPDENNVYDLGSATLSQDTDGKNILDGVSEEDAPFIQALGSIGGWLIEQHVNEETFDPSGTNNVMLHFHNGWSNDDEILKTYLGDLKYNEGHTRENIELTINWTDTTKDLDGNQLKNQEYKFKFSVINLAESITNE
jgi:hypothetical protein